MLRGPKAALFFLKLLTISKVDKFTSRFVAEVFVLELKELLIDVKLCNCPKGNINQLTDF